MIHLKSWRIDMTREEAKQLLPIIQAFAEGEIIECRTKPGTISAGIPNEWTEIKEIGFWNGIEYRIKTEPKYRSFKNAEECLAEMQKHQPVGWITSQGAFFYIIYIEDKLFGYGSACGAILHSEFNDVLKHFTFVDGTPFGIKVEE